MFLPAPCSQKLLPPLLQIYYLQKWHDSVQTQGCQVQHGKVETKFKIKSKEASDQQHLEWWPPQILSFYSPSPQILAARHMYPGRRIGTSSLKNLAREKRHRRLVEGLPTKRPAHSRLFCVEGLQSLRQMNIKFPVYLKHMYEIIQTFRKVQKD